MTPMKLFSIALPVLLGAGLLAAQGGALRGTQPTDLGVKDGRLKAPSATRNSVSSQAGLYPEHPQNGYASIEPLPLKGGDVVASLSALSKALQSVPGVTVLDQQPDYLYAQAQTRWLKFVDDMEFWANPATGAVELRSASRLGREDFGANRQRIEAVRAAYLAQP
ncbi:MAG: DUF1499 domain-containing protein [Hydrogenophaga sp.]|uniref:DUF1499 domain-containing protein n=1 Tax=Hydrogenophaga sp. TaxID=1904254 RepID=UPI0027322B08|nr:DUF1499 domain-containing protein [Hydrogenophaga sp.]MDP2163039.1 DUF1499 domain-containing protein [Hydrogenophaga sp.]MDP3476545.1 DUF1499 domain-containing protein [Hydrogenophaga sp.]